MSANQSFEDCTSVLWKREFAEVLDEIDDGLNARRSAEALRFVISTGLLALNDIHKDPEKFFLAHRMLARQVPRMGSNLWIRFNLQYNLFAGSICALGSLRQVRQFLRRNEARPSLGCIALTEQDVGDMKEGFQVNTTAELAPDGTQFILNTPNDYAAKTWISQGLIADEAIVIATLIVHKHSYGPQAFLIRLRDQEGELLPGIDMIDMGPKEAGGDLDNARITFDHLRIPISTHLSRYLEIKNDTVVHHAGRKVRTMDIIGQRLYTGRVTVAQGALRCTRSKLESVSNNFEANTVCWTPLLNSRRGRVGPDGRPRLSKGLLEQAFHTLDRLDRFAAKVEAELCVNLLHDVIPTERSQQAIAVLKVEAVETCIDISNSVKPKNTQAPSFYPGHDFLSCCKFAEGATSALMQKMARDLVRTGCNNKSKNSQVDEAVNTLKQEMQDMQEGSGCSSMDAWARCGELVYFVAEAHMDSTLQSYGCYSEE